MVDLKIICPGLVHYEDLIAADGQVYSGEILADKEFLDKIAPTLEGKPIVNWDHRKVKPEEFTKGTFQGLIASPAHFNRKWDAVINEWVDAGDGYYHAKGYVWDQATLKNIQRGFSISCAYKVRTWEGKSGTHAAVPYADAAKEGFYTHIAVVETPRYERASIELLNSIGGKVMGILNLFKKDNTEEKLELDLEATKISVEGAGDVSLSELMNSHRKIAAAKRAAALSDDQVIVVDGEKTTIGALKKSHLELKNAGDGLGLMKNSDEKMKDDHEKGDHKENTLKNCAMCNSADEDEKKKKDEEEKKNASDAATKAAEEKKEEERKNAADRKSAADRAQELDNAREKGRTIELPKIVSLSDQVAEGKSRYGSKTPLAVK